ncbi:MAG: RNA methyltransferase [Chitinophagales bacterium]
MLSKNEIKWITSLKNKKYRHNHLAFLAEGPKLVNDLLLNALVPIKIYTLDDTFIDSDRFSDKLVIITPSELKKISSLKTPHSVLAVFEMKKESLEKLHPDTKWGFAFENLQDPGNLGTILRTMDWLGINHIYCSNDSVDVYNPKVVQATMGAIGRVSVQYVDLNSFLSQQEVPIYAADMGGEPINKTKLKKGIIVFGNEGNGLSKTITDRVNQIISIPKYGKGESLNVAMSTGIIAAYLTMNEG